MTGRHDLPCPWSEALRAHKLRVTPQRLFILKALEELEQQGDHRHVSARDILAAVQKTLPGINSTTVYRTLEDLHNVGIVDLTSHNKDQVRFSIRQSHSRHGHLVCRLCHSEEILDLDCIGPLAEVVLHRYGFQLEQNHLTLSGLCQPCSKKRSMPENRPAQT